MDYANVEMDGGQAISGRLTAARQAFAGCVLAHGAGAGMTHRFMNDAATGLAERGVTTLRFQFPFMERGSRRPDPPAVAQAAVRAAVAMAAEVMPGLPLFAGGKSFGGRMTSEAQATAPLPGVRGLVFLGFPLHAAGKPAEARAAHLAAVEVPMLFMQGTRDALADLDLLKTVVHRLGRKAKLVSLEGADHAFHVPARSGRTDRTVLDEALDAVARWMRRVLEAA